MSAVQVQTTTTEIVAADPDQWRKVRVQNLGPNAIHVEIGAAATVAGGYKVAATSGESPEFSLPPGVAVNAIAASANQSSPADTRVAVA